MYVAHVGVCRKSYTNRAGFWRGSILRLALCGFQGYENRPTPFPGRMSQEATKPGFSFFGIYYFVIVSLMFRVHVFLRCVTYGFFSISQDIGWKG